MTVYKCDRCGTILDGDCQLYGMRAGCQGIFTTGEEVIHMDLCGNCFSSLLDWTEIKKEE